ncbi:MAG: alpha/beta fold hydrolase [Anaerolineae bacterium]|nr:alpha/beta fold hydrolase [Anaerolineae bacterium]
MKTKMAPIILIIIVILVGIFLSGPRPELNAQLEPVVLPDNLDQYLAESEAQFTDIVPGTEKTIVWANAGKTKTPLAIVYLHGYSATRQEAAPLCDQIAAQLGANLFYTRLTGHGRGGPAMAEATANDWLNDATEALEIGKRLGDKVVVIGVSTGGTLAAWLATQSRDAVLAYVLMSPNFAPKDPAAQILTWPWAEQLVRVIVGPERSWEPLNDQQARYWTCRYPSKALLPMMSLVKYVRALDLEAIRAPILVIYSPNDQVVNPREVERAYARFGSEVKEIKVITQSENPESHVLAGDILAPGDTPAMAETILAFVMRVK